MGHWTNTANFAAFQGPRASELPLERLAGNQSRRDDRRELQDDHALVLKLASWTEHRHPAGMRPPLPIAGFDNAVVIDTQVVLEARPLEQLPWGSLFTGSTILLVCRQVQSEIDAKKNDGRLGKRARAFNKLLDLFIESRQPVPVPGVTGVSIALFSSKRIAWDRLDDLDREDPDDRIVAQTLHAHVDEPSRLVVFSHDMRPRDAAHTHGLLAKKLPEAWLRDPNPSPEQRRLLELENKVRLLSADQPEIAVRIEAVSPLPWIYRSVAEADPAITGHILGSVLATAPAGSRSNRWAFELDFDSTLTRRLAAWEEHVREDIPLMHRGLARTFAQHALRVVVENSGSVSAEGLSLEIRTGNAVLHSVPYQVMLTGPQVPEPRALHEQLAISTRHLGPGRREPFVFYWEQQEPGDHVILSCASFRQGKSYVCELTIELLETTTPKAHVEAIVTAANMKGDARALAIIDVQREDPAFGEVLEPTRGLVMRPPFILPRDIEEDEFITYRNNGDEIDE